MSNTQFFQSFGAGMPDYFATEEEADAAIESLHNVDESYEDIGFYDVFRSVDITQVDLVNFRTADFDALGSEKIFWGETSAETKQVMIDAVGAIKEHK